MKSRIASGEGKILPLLLSNPKVMESESSLPRQGLLLLPQGLVPMTWALGREQDPCLSCHGA